MHRPLSQVMVDAEDHLLVKGREENPIKLLRRGEVMSKRLLDNDAGSLGASSLGKVFHDGPEEQRRDGEVVRRPLGGAEFLADGLERRRVVVIAGKSGNITTVTNPLDKWMADHAGET